MDYALSLCLKALPSAIKDQKRSSSVVPSLKEAKLISVDEPCKGDNFYIPLDDETGRVQHYLVIPGPVSKLNENLISKYIDDWVALHAKTDYRDLPKYLAAKTRPTFSKAEVLMEEVPGIARLFNAHGTYANNGSVIIVPGSISREDLRRQPPLTYDEIIDKYGRMKWGPSGWEPK